MFSGALFMVKTAKFKFCMILREISQKIANIFEHGTNFETNGGRARAPDISLRPAKTRLRISRKTAPHVEPQFSGFLKKAT